MKYRASIGWSCSACVCVCGACVQEKGDGLGWVSVHFIKEIHIWDIYFFKYRSLALADI